MFKKKKKIPIMHHNAAYAAYAAYAVYATYAAYAAYAAMPHRRNAAMPQRRLRRRGPDPILALALCFRVHLVHEMIK
jgi:hypothetical protein